MGAAAPDVPKVMSCISRQFVEILGRFILSLAILRWIGRR
jgi:hypothetical protein